jgi:hypothetical protein
LTYKLGLVSCLKATGMDEIRKSLAVHFSELTKENRKLIGFSHIRLYVDFLKHQHMATNNEVIGSVKILTWGILWILGAVWFWYYSFGNPLDELALIRRAQIAPGSTIDTWRMLGMTMKAEVIGRTWQRTLIVFLMGENSLSVRRVQADGHRIKVLY